MHYWSVDLASVGLLLALGWFYAGASGWRLQRGMGLYVAGLVLLALVQFSPLHLLGMTCSMSAHMISHMLLLLLVAPLLTLGLPRQPVGRAGLVIGRVSAFFQAVPWLGWLIGLGTMWFWHIPGVYAASIAHTDAGVVPLCTLAGPSTDVWTNLIHLAHPVSLVLAGVCFIWPVLGPQPNRRVFPLAGVLYLFTACVGCSLLGMLITFAPIGSFQAYASSPTYYALMSLLPTSWQLEPAVDQQTAGLLMWVPGCLVYLTGALWLFFSWLTSSEDDVASTGASVSVRRVTT
jgi:cytochrome c oxidase assembly factor CtaG